jgi:spore coat-associated protein N
MGWIPLSRLLSLAAVCAVAVAWAGSGAATPAAPEAVLTQATGDLHVANSQDGRAIFQATGLAPGRSVSGTVELANSGSLPGDLGLQQLGLQDQPGAGGGRLSDVIHLDVSDITAGSSVPIFTGQLGGLGSRSLGSIGPSDSRTFRFTASLPEGGDNAYAGSGLTVSYQWTATSTGSGSGGSGGSEPVVKIRLRSTKLLTRGFLDVIASCDIACRVSAYGRVPRTKRRTATLTIPNRAARIRLKVGKKARGQLLRKLRTKRRVVLRVNVSVTAAGGGPARAYTRKLSVKRATAKRRR